MELTKTKFKQTEIGLIPEDWGIDKFENFISNKRGGASIKPHEFTNKGVIVIPKSGVVRGGFLNIARKDIQYCSKSFWLSHKNNSVDELFLVVVLRDLVPSGPNLGLIVSIPKKGNYILAQGTYGFKTESEKCHYSYLVQYSNTNQYRLLMQQNMVGSTQVFIRSSRLWDLKIPLPPLPEQKAIAQVLDDTDNLIQAIEQKLAKKSAIKQGATQRLLTPKEDWEVKKLGEIGDGIIGLTYSPNDVRKNGTLVLRSSNVQNGQLSFKDNVFVEMILPNRVIVKENDILICVRNGSKRLIGKCALINKKTEGSAFGAFMTVYRSEYSKYVFYVFQSHFIQRQIDEVMGATINQITNKDLNSFEVPFPPKQKQTEIVTILSDMDKEIQQLEQKLLKYKQLKQGLMKNLLTGKIRLV